MPKPIKLYIGVVMALVTMTSAHAQYRDEAKPDGITEKSKLIILGQDVHRKDPTPIGVDGHPSLTGYWKLLHEDGKPDGNIGKDLPGYELPYSPAGRAQLVENFKQIDPEARCIITGLPRAETGVLPFEIIHTPERLASLYQLGWHRWVWIDGRAPASDPDPRYAGNAVGRWEGNTLVIESHAFHDSKNGKAWLDDNANPISEKAVLVERWTRPDFWHLDLQLTYTDPVYYTKPISYTRHFVHAPLDEHLKEVSCEWNTPWLLGSLEPGPGKISPDGNRYFGPDKQIVPDWPLGSVSDESRATGYWLYRKNKPKPSDLPLSAPSAQAPAK
ncbi:MAG: hypothetical protein QM581_02510 [Pseudomonas sp.]